MIGLEWESLIALENVLFVSYSDPISIRSLLLVEKSPDKFRNSLEKLGNSGFLSFKAEA
jgi:hypothetical protein